MLVDRLLSGDTTSTRYYESLDTTIPAQWPQLLALAQHRDPLVREALVSTLPFSTTRPGRVGQHGDSTDRGLRPEGQRPCLLCAGSAVARRSTPHSSAKLWLLGWTISTGTTLRSVGRSRVPTR